MMFAIERSRIQLPVGSLPGGNCTQTGKLSRHITITKVNSTFHLSGVGKSSTGLSGWVETERVHHMSGDAP